MSKTLIHGKTFVIDMPLDKDGRGPINPGDAAYIQYEVWDEVCHTICICKSREDAETIASLINHSSLFSFYRPTTKTRGQ